MKKVTKADRTHQVQFRMDPDTFKKLKIAIIHDENMHSMADLFNAAAKKYLEEKERDINGKLI